MKISWKQLRALRATDWGVLLHCLWVIPTVEWSVRWRDPRCWLRAIPAKGKARSKNAASSEPAERIARWVDAAYRRTPFQPTCLTRSLVLYRLLCSRDIPCQLHIGLRKQNAVLEGHAWVESGRLAPDPAGFDVTLSF